LFGPFGRLIDTANTHAVMLSVYFWQSVVAGGGGGGGAVHARRTSSTFGPAAPVVASYARELGAPTVAGGPTPSAWEGLGG